MADALDFDATETPQDVIAVLALQANKSYVGQNVSTTATLRVRPAMLEPAPTARAFKIEAGSYFTIKPDGTPYWLWTDDPSGCPVIMDEAA